MNTLDYKSIKSRVEIELREKASRFFAIAMPITREMEVNEMVASLWKQNPKASHVCYAYRIGYNGSQYKMHDDGEPSGTAGKPIYGQLLSAGVSDTAVFIVRYFGGTKLGTSGLISAYKEAAKIVLEGAEKVDRKLVKIYKLTFDYEHMGQVMNDLKSLDITIVEKDFNDIPSVQIALSAHVADANIRMIKARLLDFDLESIDDDTKVAFCNIIWIKDDII
jgi:uncharacterized YigZ family protein